MTERLRAHSQEACLARTRTSKTRGVRALAAATAMTVVVAVAGVLGLSRMTLAQAASDDVAASVAAVGVSTSASASQLSEDPADKFAATAPDDDSARSQLSRGAARAPYEVEVIGPDQAGELTPGVTVGEDGSVLVLVDDGWQVGEASAYTLVCNDGYDATASGTKLTETSMTVAVPANRLDLLGKTCEIYYNGKTVRAKVTDTGGFAPLGRALDLAGGVWRALGASSTDEWGVRTVSYRFVE